MTALDTTAPTLDSAKTALREHAKRIEVDPRTNSVFAYAQDLFRALETDQLTLADLQQTSEAVYGDLILARAERFRKQHDAASDVTARLQTLAEKGWDAFKTLVETPLGGVVFTAHPTFALSPTIRKSFAKHVSENSAASAQALRAAVSEDGRAWSKSISLLGEHDEAQDTILHAQSALSAYACSVLDVAKQAFPDKWRTLQLNLPTLASWVGYDLDGRTDIHWSQSFALRLQEKAVQLSRYVTDIETLADRAGGDTKARLSVLSEQLAAAASLTEAEAEIFAEDLTVPDNLVRAANQLTAEQSDRLVSAAPVIETLRSLAATAPVIPPQTYSPLKNPSPSLLPHHHLIATNQQKILSMIFWGGILLLRSCAACLGLEYELGLRSTTMGIKIGAQWVDNSALKFYNVRITREHVEQVRG